MTRVSGAIQAEQRDTGVLGSHFPYCPGRNSSGRAGLKEITRGEGACSGHRAPASEVRVRVGSDVCHREGVILSACWPFSGGLGLGLA